jgi:putative addiction module component (TIGR02574 family)
MANTTSNVDGAFLVAEPLGPAEKLQLISRLWESIRLGGDFRPSDSDLAEIQRRSAELDSGVVKAVPWKIVDDAVRARLASHD